MIQDENISNQPLRSKPLSTTKQWEWFMEVLGILAGLLQNQADEDLEYDTYERLWEVHSIFYDEHHANFVSQGLESADTRQWVADLRKRTINLLEKGLSPAEIRTSSDWQMLVKDAALLREDLASD